MECISSRTSTAVPWYSITRYGWGGNHGVPFLGPNSNTQYVVYSPLVPTGYPYSTGGSEYSPYAFDDGAWILKANYTGPIKIINGFYYENTYVISPILPGTWQYPIAQIPPTNITIQIKTEVKPQQAITLLNTTLLKTQLQQPQGIACGDILGPGGPGEIIIPGGTYVVQPITINETTKINSITVFASYTAGIAMPQIIISSAPLIITSGLNILYTYTFGIPWWCLPHSWATPITANPGITLKPGTYYVILTFPVQGGQTICEQIPNTPKALLINATTGQVIQQLPCTLGTIITTNPRNNSQIESPINIAIDILNSTVIMNGNQEVIINIETKNITDLVLTVSTSQISFNYKLIVKISIVTSNYMQPKIQQYLIPTLGLIPEYVILILAIILIFYF